MFSFSLCTTLFSHYSHPHINIGIGRLKQQEQFITLNLNQQTSHSPPSNFHSLPILQRYSSSLSQTLSTQPQPHLKSSSLPLISSLARPLQVAMHNKRTQHIHNYSRCHHWREPQEKVYPVSSICFPSLTTGGSH